MSRISDKEGLSKHHRNMNLLEEFSSRLEGLISMIGIFLKYRKTYCNYLNVFLHVIKKEYPILGILKNGSQVKLTSFFQSYNLAQFQDHRDLIDYDLTTDTVALSTFANTRTNSGIKLKFKGGLHNGELVNIFLEDVYRILPVEGRVVIDIGSNIGDSSIYFALRGAGKIIGVEPILDNYEMAIENIRLNNFADRISLMLAGCSVHTGSINVSDGFEAGIASHTTNYAKPGAKIPSVTLESILKEYKIQNGETVLKMDCEGCEYDIILSASDDLLRQFRYMLIEYHQGYIDLKERLEKCAFDVMPLKLTGKPGGPIVLPNVEKPGEWYYIGYIYVKRQNKT